MKRTNRWMAGAVAVLISFGVFALPMTAQASEEGRRNTALGLGALAAGLLLTQHNKLPGIIAGVGAAVAFSQVDKRHHYDRYGYYDDRYNSGYGYSGYDYGYNYDKHNRYDHDRDDWRRNDRDRDHDWDNRGDRNRRGDDRNDNRHGWGHRR